MFTLAQESYLRDDVVCGSPLCQQCRQTTFKLSSEASHYLASARGRSLRQLPRPPSDGRARPLQVVGPDALADWSEVLELPDVSDVILPATAVRQARPGSLDRPSPPIHDGSEDVVRRMLSRMPPCAEPTRPAVLAWPAGTPNPAAGPRLRLHASLQPNPRALQGRPQERPPPPRRQLPPGGPRRARQALPPNSLTDPFAASLPHCSPSAPNPNPKPHRWSPSPTPSACPRPSPPAPGTPGSSAAPPPSSSSPTPSPRTAKRSSPGSPPPPAPPRRSPRCSPPRSSSRGSTAAPPPGSPSFSSSCRRASLARSPLTPASPSPLAFSAPSGGGAHLRRDPGLAAAALQKCARLTDGAWRLPRAGCEGGAGAPNRPRGPPRADRR